MGAGDVFTRFHPFTTQAYTVIRYKINRLLEHFYIRCMEAKGNTGQVRDLNFINISHRFTDIFGKIQDSDTGPSVGLKRLLFPPSLCWKFFHKFLFQYYNWCLIIYFKVILYHSEIFTKFLKYSDICTYADIFIINQLVLVIVIKCNTMMVV